MFIHRRTLVGVAPGIISNAASIGKPVFTSLVMPSIVAENERASASAQMTSLAVSLPDPPRARSASRITCSKLSPVQPCRSVTRLASVDSAPVSASPDRLAILDRRYCGGTCPIANSCVRNSPRTSM